MNKASALSKFYDRRASARSAHSRIDYFLHPSFYESPDKLHRARVLAWTLCTITGITALIVLIMAFAPLPNYIRMIGIACSIESIIFPFLLFKFKRDGSYNLCSISAIGVVLAGVVAATFFTGGPTQSAVTQVLAMSPLLAFFFGGIRVGLSASLFIGFLIGILLLLEHIGFHFPQVTPASAFGISRATVLLINTAIIAALAYFYEYAAAMLRDERDREHWKVKQLAQTDSLTGLANRRVFDEILTERIKGYQAGAQPRPFALCYLDLDGFKAINDRHGHDVGDQVLRAISIRLRSSLRGTDIAGRQGGDEFMMLLDQLEPGPALQATAQRFQRIIAEPIETSAGLLSVGGSFGFAIFPHHGRTSELLKKSADAAMYEAKRRGTQWHVAKTDALHPGQPE